MFTCPNCKQEFPDNEQYTYYLRSRDGNREFRTPQYACGRCIVKKTESGYTERASVPPIYYKAFGDEIAFGVFSAPKRPYYPDCGE